MKPVKQSIYFIVSMLIIFGQVTSTFAYTIDGDAVRNSKVVGRALGSLDRLIYGDRETIPVQVKNVAQGKTATQSSTAFGAEASRAVDGNTFGRWSGRSVTHTALDGVDPWWQVDLGGLYDITEIKIFKRTDCCLQVFDNYRILYSDRPIDSSAREYIGLQRATNAESHSFKKSAKRVRYLRVTLKGKTPLYMAEVQVFGVPASSASTTSGPIVNASSVEYAQNSSNRLAFTRTGATTWRQGPVAAKINWTETKRDSSTIFLSRRNPNSGQEQKAELNLTEKKILIYSRPGFAPTQFSITKVVGISTTPATTNSASACSLSDWSGAWNTSFKEVLWTIQSDGSLAGTYQPAKHKLIAKPVAGNPCVVEGTWKQPNSSGRIRFTMNADKRSFKGLWSYGTADPKSNWSGTKKATVAARPKVNPNNAATATNVTEVKFFSRNNMTLAQAQNLAAQNDWKLATRAQVTAAWQSKGLNAFAYGRTSDGKFCVPIQKDNVGFKRGANCGVTGGNQGFLYVKKIPDVKFYSKVNLTLAQAQNLAAQNGWQLATPAQVISAWENGGLNAFAYGRTSDGGYCVPVQKDKVGFKRGANCGATGGNQGFLYVEMSAANAAEVGFYPKNNVTMAQARSIAGKYGWKLATPTQVAAAWKFRGLHALAYGRTSDGGFCVPIQQFMGRFKKGANCGVTGGNQGFLYVNPSAPVSTNRRSGYIDLASSTTITGPPRTIGTKYAGRLLHTVWNKSVQHPAQRTFGLGDAVMMRKAATLMLKTQRRSASNTSVNSLLDSVSRDATARYRFAPYLLKVTFDALATKRPDAGQLAFRKNFEAYMGLWRFEQSLDTLNRWNSFKRENERSQFDPNKYNQGPTAGNLLPMRPADVPKFLKTHTNPMLLGNDGRNAIRLLLEPAAAASLPEFRNDRLAKLGADMDAVAAGIGVGTTIATSAGTLGLVSTTLLSGSVVGSLTPTATAAGISNTANYVPIAKLLLKTGKVGGFTLGGATTIGVTIAIALAVVIGIAIARQAISDQLDRRLKREFERGFDPVNVNSMINTRDVSKRGFNRSAVLGFLLKMLIADPAERGMLTLKQPDPRTIRAGLPKPGVVTVRHKGAYVSDVTLSYLDANRKPVRIVRKTRPIHQVDRFNVPGDATQVRLSIVMYTGLAGSQSKVTLIDRVLRKDEIYNKCFTTVGTTIVGRGLKEGACEN